MRIISSAGQSRFQRHGIRPLCGGNTQLANFCGASGAWDKRFQAAAGNRPFAREILVALQPIAGQTHRWDQLAEIIETAPANWRWWIRRHPASRAQQDSAFGRLLSLRGDNVVIEPASELPLPALLPRMTALVSLMSGAAGEAAIFGVPAFFLSDEAQGPFGNLIAKGCARIVDPVELVPEIEKLSEPRRLEINQPSLAGALRSLEKIADGYHDLIVSSRDESGRYV